MLPYSWAEGLRRIAGINRGTSINSESSSGGGGGIVNPGLFLHISYLFLYIFHMFLHIPHILKLLYTWAVGLGTILSLLARGITNFRIRGTPEKSNRESVPVHSWEMPTAPSTIRPERLDLILTFRLRKILTSTLYMRVVGLILWLYKIPPFEK